MVGSLTTADGSLTLANRVHGETYRSRHGALSEASHVFLGSSGVADVMRREGSAAVLEVGFGTGLNFLVTAAAAARAGATLRYTAFERDPLPVTALVELRYEELLAPFYGPAALLDWLGGLGTPTPAGTHRWRHGDARLELVVGEAAETVSGLGPRTFDAVYLDPFSPPTDPGSWEERFLTALAGTLGPRGRLVTYSVSGEVRRRLARAGLEVKKVPGPPGGKRESLVAQVPAP